MTGMNSLLCSVRWMLSYQAVRLLVGFFVGAWVARALGPEQFGVLSTAAAVMAIAWCGVELGMRQLLLKEAGNRKRAGSVLVGTLFKLWLVGGCVVVALLACWNEWSGALPWPVFGATALPLLLMAFTVHNNWQEAHGRADIAARNSMTGYLGGAVARVACLVWWPSMPAIAWTMAAEQVTTSALGVATSPKRSLWWPGWDGRVARILLSRGAVLVMGQAGTLLLLRADTVMIEHIRGSAEAGIYGAAVRLSELVYLLSPMLVTVLLPKLSLFFKRQDKSSFHDLAKHGTELTTTLALVSAIVLWIAGPLAVQLLFGAAYESSIPVLLVHCLAVVPYLQAEWRHAVMVTLDRPQVTAWLSWLAVIMNVGLNLAWIPQHGALGAAWATLVSYTLCGIGATWLVRDLRWFARVQLLSLLAPVSWLLRPRRHMAQWQQMFTTVRA